MTNPEIDILKSTIRGLWPRVGKPGLGWAPGEWSVLEEAAGRIQIDADQAVAAIRRVKAKSHKYPTVSVMLEALENAENKPAVGPATALPPTMSRLWELRKRLESQGYNLTDKSPADIVIAYWRHACCRSMRMRANIPPSYEADFHADAGEICSMSKEERAEWWGWLMDTVQSVEIDPELAEHAAANGRLTPERAAKLLGNDWNARPRKLQRHKRMAELAQAVKLAQKQIEGAV